MQQSEILSIAERLIPAFHSEDFDYLLSQMTEGEAPSAKLLVKMELNRVMAPCTKPIDLRGRVQGECREYELDGLKHWLDDVAFNAYHKNFKKYNGYTEGMWEALINTKNNFRVMKKNGIATQKEISEESSPFHVEPITLGYDLKRQENRLKVYSQVEITLQSKQLVHAVSIDLSPSGAKFKVPTAFNYKLGEMISVSFVELQKTSEVEGIHQAVNYRIVGIDDSYENDAVKFIRALKISESNVVNELIEESLQSSSQKIRHDNQDKIIRARTRGYEHTYLKHTCNLPLFFSGSELKLVLMTENNLPIWNYWQDERNQQALGSLFHEQRISLLATAGVRGSSNTIYSFTHDHDDKKLFFSMLMPEAKREERQLFWHVGARRKSWKAFKISVFELSDPECQQLAQHASELGIDTKALSHCGILQEIADTDSAADYLFTEKPKLPSKTLNRFRHTRQVIGNPTSIYFDAKSRRKEPRYQFKSPIELKTISGNVYTGSTLDLSKHGLSIKLDNPNALKAEEACSIHLRELQLYDKSLPLTEVPYKVIRVGADNQTVQMSIDESPASYRTISFFDRLIKHNQQKLPQKKELLPSNELLEGLHNILLDKMVSNPVFIEKIKGSLVPMVIGVNYPLPAHMVLMARLGIEKQFSLEPIYKGRMNTLLSVPMKRLEGAEPQYHEIYISALIFGNRIQSLQTKLSSDFENIKERLIFIKKAMSVGDFYVLRVSGAPIFEPLTNLLKADIEELTQISMHQARSLEKEISSTVGYGEIVDITDEVLVRLELTK
ncbi:PilZ domain-containing protein [Vibrio sp. 10N.261.55.A7]|uniref:PilZ domain-containing protein n=1 Tax=Vibrio sp. 10N.261.55.A7 TaxID=1880851 RepID=UPI000C83F91F|nr:PilZ domain-containing protein [Vibrio sp. 10N.261.55.A7]PMJ92563.1 pilus assembly protein PilZ [Vibrio sp. 10N.261.55.A7]